MELNRKLDGLETIPVWSDDPDETCAGKVLGLGKNTSYEAARRGDIPTIRIGKRLIVPVRRLIKVLEGGAADKAEEGTEG